VRANARLGAYSVDCLRALRRDEALEYGQVCRGTLKIYRDAEALGEGVKMSRLIEEEGSPPEILDRSGVTALEPQLSPVAAGLAGGIHFPGDESGDAYRFCGALAATLQHRGVAFRSRTEVRGFAMHGAIAGSLDTSAGPLEADAYVLCAGSWSPYLAAMLRTDLPVQPVKGYSITIPMPADGMPRLPVVDDAMHIAFTPMDGRLRVAGTAEFAGPDATVRPERIRNLVNAVARVFPRCVPQPGADIRAWAGLRPYCCDGVPIIGRTRADNVFVNTGHGHLGWTLAAGSGKLLSHLVSGVAPEIDPTPYRPGRF
jgi:D-amino-acid dehydrogenase